MDEPIIWYEGSGTSDRRFLQGDERGSIISVSNSSATSLAINTYDEYGIPGSSNSGRFQYTGQIWLDEIGLYYYKARMYSPTLGRFMQTDPIGYGDGMNMYAYVGNDPVNAVDPSGLSCKHTGGIASSGMPLLGGGVVPETYCDPAHPDDDGPPIVVTAWRGIGVSFSIENYIKSGCKDINCQANALEQQRWSQWMADADRDADNGYGKGGPQSDGIDCSGYDLLAIADDVTGTANTLAGIANDILPKAAKLTPQGRALSIALNAIEGTAAAARIGAAYVRYDSYGDTLGLVNAVAQTFSGSAAAAAYGRVARLAGFKNTNLSQAIIERIVPAGTDLGSSGPCATRGR